MTDSITFKAGHFYVMDRFASSAQEAYISGPYTSRADAEADRLERNIADDCEVFQAPGRPTKLVWFSSAGGDSASDVRDR